jgi:hypothetical protein
MAEANDIERKQAGVQDQDRVEAAKDAVCQAGERIAHEGALLAIPTTRSGIIVFIKKVENTSNDATHAAITNHMSHLHLSR